MGRLKVLQKANFHKLIYINITYNNITYIYIYLIQILEVNKGCSLINITEKGLFKAEVQGIKQ